MPLNQENLRKWGLNTTQESQSRRSVCATNQSYIDDLIGSKKACQKISIIVLVPLSFTIHADQRKGPKILPGIIEELLKKKFNSEDLKNHETGFTQLYEELSRLRLTRKHP